MGGRDKPGHDSEVSPWRGEPSTPANSSRLCSTAAPTTFFLALPQGVGGRDKPGHDSEVVALAGKTNRTRQQ